MKSAKLKIILHSGKGLKDVKKIGIMNPYAKIWISGNGMELKHKTNIAKKGDSDPVWDCSVDFENVFMNKDSVLFIEIKHDGTMYDRKIGLANIPFADLLTGDASGDRVSFWLTISGEKQGQIILSYRFSDVVERPDEDGASTSTNPVPVAPAKKKREKAKQAVKGLGRVFSMFAAQVAAAIVVDEVLEKSIDLDGKDGPGN